MPHVKRTTATLFRVLTTVSAVTLCAAAAHAGGPDQPQAAQWTAESTWDIPGEWVVDFRDDVEEATIQAALSGHGLAFRETALEDDTRIEIVQGPVGKMATALGALRGDARVEGIEPHAKVRAQFVPNDPMYGEQWHMERVQAAQAWDWAVGRGVTVAVVDTGIACSSFKDFNKATDLNNTRCVAGYNFVAGNTRANDDQGHGTHVAGTIAQSTNNGLGGAGLAFRAQLMPVKVLSAEGWGTTTAVADGIRFAADHGAQVINLSLGGPRNSRVLQSAVTYAVKKGVVVVAAAGNSGGWVGYPGGCDGVIGVSATTSTDKLAWFSSRGPGVDIAAPGVNVLQQTVCNRGRNGCEIFPKYSGTSMASPHVAAAAALLVSLGVTDAAAVEKNLRATAKTLDESDEGRAQFGSGLLQAADAVSRVSTWQAIARSAALLVLALLAFGWSRRRGKTIKPTRAGFWLAAITTSLGLLFFAPWLLSREQLWVDLLSRPLADWDLLLSPAAHAYLPLANLAVPLGLTVALYGRKGARPWLAGLAIGTSAYLVSVIALGQHAGPFGWVLSIVWCALHAAACFGLGALLLREER